MFSIHSFKPIIDENSKVLILGSIPGPESLKKQQYYANPNNQFWRIIYTVFDEEAMAPEYEEKVLFLLDHQIALWDVFHSADRNGAMDADIKSEVLNDVPGLIQIYSGIKCILLAGRKAETSFRKHFAGLNADVVYVPSTSPAYAKMKLDAKIEAWKYAIASAQ